MRRRRLEVSLQLRQLLAEVRKLLLAEGRTHGRADLLGEVCGRKARPRLEVEGGGGGGDGELPSGVVEADADGRPARSSWRVLETFGGEGGGAGAGAASCSCSLVEVKPHSGRKHQVRVHMGHLNAPLVGRSRQTLLATF